MSTRDLSTRLSALSDTVRTTFQLISRLSKLSFAPGSTPLDGEGDVRIELTQDIHDSLKQQEEDLDLLQQEVDDLVASGGRYSRKDGEKDRERARLAAHVARLGEDLRHARSQFRRAQLNAKRASEAAKQKERELLFTSLRQTNISDPSAPPGDLFAGRRTQQNKNLTQDELLVGASSDVTSALRRTHDLLTSELSRSRFAQETLEQSTAALADLGERYSGLDNLLSSSKNLLGTLVRSQKSDTWYLETAFYLLCATIGWLIFRRLIYGPAWWFIWLPLKYLLFKPFIFIFTAFGIKTNSAGDLSQTTSITNTRPPLRVHPSAKGGPPKFTMSGGIAPAIPVGGGGKGAKVGKDGSRMQGEDPSPEGSMSQKIGQMVEDSRQQGEQSGDSRTHKEPVRRADGTILEERGDKPRNPKKKMFEADVEDARHAPKRDEL